MKSALVFIIFNRADTAGRTFEMIRQARPSRLFVIADGPRPEREGEVERCAEARAIVDRVDWQCEVTRYFSETNLGCRRRISTGLREVFSEVDEAIVLEDDCLPDPSFFPYCEEMLERYRQDERVMHIAGTNYQFGRRRTPWSYYFSRYNHCWGWASWSRAWRHYDDSMSLWPEVRDRGLLNDILAGDDGSVHYWERAFQEVYDGKIDSWSFVWTLSCWMRSGLTILPAVNLISNIGFNNRGAHTLNRRSRFAGMETEALAFPLAHPPFMIRDREADSYTQKNNFRDGRMIRLARRLMRYHLSRNRG